MPVRKNPLWEKLHAMGNDCYNKGMDFDKIQKILLAEHDDEPLIFAVMKVIKSEHYAELSKQGRKLIIIGGVIMLAGFLITCFNFHSNLSISFAMYGLTSIGLSFVFYGLYKIIG